MLYSAPKIVTLHHGILEDAAVRVLDHRIADVGRRRVMVKKYPNEPEKSLENTVLLPGLINAHTRLEYGPLREAMDYSNSFAHWLKSLAEKKKQLQTTQIQNAVHLGTLEALKSGTTTILDVSETGDSFKVLFNEPIRSVIFLEFTGGFGSAAERSFGETLAKAQGFFANDLSRWGISPHSPYMTSRTLFRRCLAYADEQRVHVMVRAGQSAEEGDLFAGMGGALADYILSLGADALEKDLRGAVSYLLRNHLLPKNALLLTGPWVEEEDLLALAGLNVSIVLCPRSFARFNLGRFPFVKYLEKGVNLCLGTDSLALCESLNLFDEMFCLKQEAPELSDEQILKMAVLGGARAIGMGGELGQIRPGFLADIIGIETRPSSGPNVLEEILTEDREIKFVMVDGREVLA